MPGEDQPETGQVNGSREHLQDDGGTRERKPSTADRLVGLALDSNAFGRSEDGEVFAVPKNGARFARPLRGGRDSLKAELSAQYFELHGRTPSSAALADALTVLDGKARRTDPTPVFLRVAKHKKRVVLDLANAEGQVVVIRPGGWRVTKNSPSLFYRNELTSSLPVPDPEGSVDELRDLLNVSDDGWAMVLGFLVSALVEDISHPIGLITGEHGSGKTTAEKMLARLLDPSPAQVRAAPTSEPEWVVAAAGSWVVALDNVSHISPWLSDALCRAVTGEGWVRRALYTDRSRSVISFRRVILIDSIDPGGLRGDLADRIVPIELESIPDEDRRMESRLWREFDRSHPRILGGLLNILADVLDELPLVRLEQLPRMADFARILAAVDRVTEMNTLEVYLSSREALARAVIEGDPVALAIRSLVENRDLGQPWVGTAQELMELTTPERPPRYWPTSPRGLAAAVRRARPTLATNGVEVEFRRAPGGSRPRLITVTRTYEIPEDSAPSDGSTE